jgi:hypothetical protein
MGRLPPSGQDLCLGKRPHVADLVEEHGSAGRDLELPCPTGGCAGEGAPFVAEQLAFEQALGNGGTVDGHHSLVCARAQVVNRGGRQLLAGPCLAGDEYVGVACRHASQIEANFDCRGALADHVRRVGSRRARGGTRVAP